MENLGVGVTFIGRDEKVLFKGDNELCEGKLKKRQSYGLDPLSAEHDE
jgi:hypothetical protein